LSTANDVSIRNEGTICPESTLESAQRDGSRRNFIRKAALATAAVGIGAGLVGANRILPESTASTDCAQKFCYLTVEYNTVFNAKNCNAGTLNPGVAFGLCSGEGIASNRSVKSLDFYTNDTQRLTIGHCTGCVRIYGETSFCSNVYVNRASLSVAGSIGSGTSVCAPTINGSNYACNGNGLVGKSIRSTVPPLCPCCPCQSCRCVGGQGSGVLGTSVIGAGVAGSSCCGIGVSGVGAIGVSANGELSGICATSTSSLIGSFKNTSPSSATCDKSALVRFQNACSTPVDWNIGVAGKGNSIKVPDGYFYVQHSTTTTPAISVNKCNSHVGIGVANPCRVLCVNGRIHTNCGMGLGTQTINTTLAINGSVSMKSRQVKAAATLTLSDFAVLANASTAAFTITLPAVSSTAGACNGMILFIKKIDSSANGITIAASGTDTIEGKTSVVLKKQFDYLQLISNNSNSGHEWFVLGSVKCGSVYS
jgi:hypothetical protein